MVSTPTLETDRPATLRLSFPPALPNARTAAATVRSFFAEQGVGEAELFACELCVAEACNNAVEHVSDAGRQHLIFVDAVHANGQLELRVSDHTPGFDWPKELPKLPEHSGRGRGLFIIHSFMDEVAYLRGTYENVLIMRKKRRDPAGSPAAREAGLTLEESKRQHAECKRAVTGMARELCFRSEMLTAVFRCCAELGRAGASAGFEERLLADMLHLTSADWYVLRLVSPDQRELVIAAVSAPDLASMALPVPAGGEISLSLEARVATSRASARFSARECAATEPLCTAGENANGVVYPLYASDALVGTIAIGRRLGNFAFGDLHEAIGRTFADFLAIQTAGRRHLAEDLGAKLFARELEIAHVIQRSLLPVDLPQLPGFGLAGAWHCAREVGGDFYDAIALSEHTSLLMVADVMGKGVPAALFAMTLRGLLRGLSALFDDPAQLLGRLNRLLYGELSAVGMFITAQVAVVDMRTRTVTAAGAGHCPMLYVAGDGAIVEPLATAGLPLGVMPDVVYQSRTVTLGQPSTLLMHTDGLTDMRNAAGEAFGLDRLTDWLKANHARSRSATELRGRLVSELNRYRGETAMADDQAFLLLTDEVATETEETPIRPAGVRGKRSVPVSAGA